MIFSMWPISRVYLFNPYLFLDPLYTNIHYTTTGDSFYILGWKLQLGSQLLSYDVLQLELQHQYTHPEQLYPCSCTPTYRCRNGGRIVQCLNSSHGLFPLSVKIYTFTQTWGGWSGISLGKMVSLCSTCANLPLLCNGPFRGKSWFSPAVLVSGSYYFHGSPGTAMNDGSLM